MKEFRKSMIYNLILLAVMALAVVFFFRWFEYRNLFIPFGKVEATPADLGLDYEEVYFTTTDDLKIHGWFVPSASATATIIFCHGNAGNISHRLDTVQLFHALNWNSLYFDYRGYGNSEGKPSEEGLYLDSQAAWNYVINRSDLDSDKVVIFGRSLGAAVAVDLALQVNPAALIMESGFSSTTAMGKLMFPFLPVGLLISQEFDSLTKIKKVTVPILIIHSPDDEIIPYGQGQKLYEAAPEPKEFFQLSGSHNDGFLLAGEKYINKLKEFVAGR